MTVQVTPTVTPCEAIPEELKPVALTFDVLLGSTLIVFSEVNDPTRLWGFEWDEDMLTFVCAEVDFTGIPLGVTFAEEDMPMFLIEMPDTQTNDREMLRFKKWLDEEGIPAI